MDGSTVVAGTTGGHRLKLHHGASQDVLKEYPDNHFDSVVCDPPYLIGFIGGKYYDDPEDLDMTPVFAECHRVLKDGGHILSFGAPRAYHKMATQIENAGFDIIDQIMWVFSSGGVNDVNKVEDAYDKWIDDLIKKQLALAAANKIRVEFVGKAPNPLKGIGSRLKPAHEPVCVGRKKLKTTRFRSSISGYNLGDCMIETEGEDDRLPSNVIGEIEGGERYFFCPRAQEAERQIGFPDYVRVSDRSSSQTATDYIIENGNPHPTVKPVALMDYQ